MQCKRLLLGDSGHITIISPKEAPDISPDFGGSQDMLLQKSYDALVRSKFRFLRYGEVTKLLMIENDDDIDLTPTDSYYFVVDWKEVQSIRRNLGLKRFDLHTTVGFSELD